MVNLGNDWDEVLKGEFDKEYYQKLRKFLIEEYKTRVIYPKMENIFSALKLTTYRDTKITGSFLSFRCFIILSVKISHPIPE